MAEVGSRTDRETGRTDGQRQANIPPPLAEDNYSKSKGDKPSLQATNCINLKYVHIKCHHVKGCLKCSQWRQHVARESYNVYMRHSLDTIFVLTKCHE